MDFTPPLLSGRFIRRYKRFFADIETSEGMLTIHVPNTGSLKGCLEEGVECLYSSVNDPKRKLKGTLQFLKLKNTWVGVNTSLPNHLARELWVSGTIPHWKNLNFLKMEYKINGNTRLDMVLAPTEKDFKEKKNLHFVEIKNVTLADGDLALFPDSITARGQKHLSELMKLKAQGFSTEILFVVQRTDCHSFSACAEIDSKYAALLREAKVAGVKITAYPCRIDKKKGVEILNSPLKLQI